MKHRLSEESGAVAVITAVILVALLTVTAFIVDLGALRADRVAGKAIADMAASAATVEYQPGTEGSALDACEEALDYAVANLRDVDDGEEPTAVGQSCEDAYDDDFVCSADQAESAVYEIGPYTITITLPVPDGDDLLEDLAHGEEFDGEACERIGVRVERERDYLLGGITGHVGGTTSPASVATVREVLEDEFASLVVLQREGCQTLYTHGNPEVRVNKLEANGDTYSGIITVDTEPSGCHSGPNNQNKVFRTGGSSLVWADGEIRSHSLGSSDPDNTYTYMDGAVGESSDDPGNLWPRPQAGERVTRAQIDYRYNCQASYDDDGAVYDPVGPHGSQPIDGCEDEDWATMSYIKELHDWLADDDGEPAGDWYEAHEEHEEICDKNAGPIEIDGEDLVFIDCSDDDFEPDEVSISGATHVLVNGTLSIGSSEQLSITGPSGDGTVLVLRDGDFDRTGGHLRLQNVFTYAVEGELSLRGSSGDILWMGMETNESLDESCLANGGPTAKCFGPLAYWGNGAVDNFIRGEASGGIIGTIFTPNALTLLRGGQSVDDSPCTIADPGWDDIAGHTGSLNLAGAQFFSERFDLGGSSGLRLCPNPNLLPTSGWERHLIR